MEGGEREGGDVVAEGMRGRGPRVERQTARAGRGGRARAGRGGEDTPRWPSACGRTGHAVEQNCVGRRPE